MTQIAVIGDDQFTLGFRLAGIRHIHHAETAEELQHAVAKARADSDVSILVMETADVARLDARLRGELVSSVKPTLVAVGEEEDDSLRHKIKQAVGVDLW
jgi:V/A-type H+-transporting ATPase subunit F